ncbi:long-chain fatty acid--CoA ligase [Myxococcota bacterium]|nr:long-chain fatty acid--CoA ligase [Myxococcota bacterium]
MNIAEHVERGAEAHPEKVAILFEGRGVTYAELSRASGRVAAALERRGVRAGDRVALFLPNIPELAIAYLGAVKLGVVAVSLSSALRSEEVLYILQDSGARVLFTTAELYAEVAPIRADAAALEHVVCCEGALDGAAHVAAWCAEGDVAAVRPRAADDDAAILYTSGTTGKPKGAVLTHGNVVSNMLATAKTTRMSADDVLHLFLPLFHCFGQNFILNGGLSAGATIVLHRRFVPDEVVRALGEHGVTMFFAVPTIYIAFLDRGVGPAQFPKVRYFFSAAATMPVEVATAWRARFGLAIHEGYGLTETSPFSAYNHAREYRPGSVGTPIEGVEMAIASEHGGEVPPGTWGEILIRGPNVMKGYFGKPEESASALRDGWFHTGDIGYRDADGYYFLVDRVKDMINVAGFKVWPREVEEVLYRHPAVLEAVVVGIEDREKGERVRALVIPKPGVAVTSDELVEWARSKLAAYKVPSELALVAQIPKSPTGKILKRVIRDEAKRAR